MTKTPYTKNTRLIDSELNKPFEEILAMTEDEFRQWCIDFRKLVVDIWDNDGNPPTMGYSEDEILAAFNKMIGANLDKFLVKDELTGEKNVIRNTTNFSGYVNSYFPSMMKTRINYSKNDDGKSIYDYFAKDTLLETFVTYASRHFKRDSFYHYSLPLRVDDLENKSIFPCTNSAKNWVVEFEDKYRKLGTHDYWLAPKEPTEYTGYNEKLKDVKNFFLNKEEIEELWDIIPELSKTNINWKKSESYQIRGYERFDDRKKTRRGHRLFPLGLKAFRVSFCQYAVNFPPLTARFLYERYSEHLKNQDRVVIYDPSAGWAGRLTGAMCSRDDRNILYIGTDPNADHTIHPGYTKYDAIANYINTRSNRARNPFSRFTHDFRIFQLGSEVIHEEPEFQEYKGQVDIVFTSPPYFAKEAYSEDETQSYKKFGTYGVWRDGFLKKTLETAVEWMKPGGYLLWNIADAKFGNEMLPLEGDSREILKNLGMEYVETLKMALAAMPGANRIAEDGSATAKNFVKVGGNILKMEPIFVYRKPL